jgi:hypothetical protein
MLAPAVTHMGDVRACDGRFVNAAALSCMVWATIAGDVRGATMVCGVQLPLTLRSEALRCIQFRWLLKREVGTNHDLQIAGFQVVPAAFCARYGDFMSSASLRRIHFAPEAFAVEASIVALPRAGRSHKGRCNVPIDSDPDSGGPAHGFSESAGGGPKVYGLRHPAFVNGSRDLLAGMPVRGLEVAVVCVCTSHVRVDHRVYAGTATSSIPG